MTAADDRMISHWWWRPGWRVGRAFYMARHLRRGLGGCVNPAWPHRDGVTRPQRGRSGGWAGRAQRPKAWPSMRMISPMPIKTMGSRMWPQRDRARATMGRLAKKCPATHQSATRIRNTST